MQIGTKLIHRVTGERYEFRKLLNNTQTLVLWSETRGLVQVPRDQVKHTVGRPPKVQAGRVRLRVIENGEAEPYTLLAEPYAGKQRHRHYRIIDQETMHDGQPIWQVWHGAVLGRNQFEIVEELAS